MIKYTTKRAPEKAKNVGTDGRGGGCPPIPGGGGGGLEVFVGVEGEG